MELFRSSDLNDSKIIAEFTEEQSQFISVYEKMYKVRKACFIIFDENKDLVLENRKPSLNSDFFI